jgi:hypothetical protein
MFWLNDPLTLLNTYVSDLNYLFLNDLIFALNIALRMLLLALLSLILRCTYS